MLPHICPDEDVEISEEQRQACTPIGQEQDRQSVAFLFARVLEEERPDVPVLSLAETLGEINNAGMHDEYRQMFEYYEDTGILPAASLKKISDITGQRYIAMLQMAAYTNNSSGRVRVFGVRFIVTKSATLRLFNQIWDSETGKIAWEANQEMTVSYETAAETGRICCQGPRDHAAAYLPGRGRRDQRRAAPGLHADRPGAGHHVHSR
jgi:hypothetical protein